MKSLTLKISLPGTLLVLVWFGLSCSPGPTQTPNSNVNGGSTTTGTGPSPTGTPDPDNDRICRAPNIDDRRTKVEQKLRRIVGRDEELEPFLQIDVAKEGDLGSQYLVVYISSKVSGATTLKGDGEMTDLSQLVRRFFKTNNCVRKVVFVVPGSAVRSPALEWIACEFPKNLCSNGECREACMGIDPGTPTPNPGNMNTNTNTNTNTSNSDSNTSNSNANFP